MFLLQNSSMAHILVSLLGGKSIFFSGELQFGAHNNNVLNERSESNFNTETIIGLYKRLTNMMFSDALEFLIGYILWFVLSKIVANKAFKVIAQYDKRNEYVRHIMDTTIGYKLDRSILTVLVFSSPFILKFVLNFVM